MENEMMEVNVTESEQIETLEPVNEEPVDTAVTPEPASAYNGYGCECAKKAGLAAVGVVVAAVLTPVANYGVKKAQEGFAKVKAKIKEKKEAKKAKKEAEKTED